MPGVQPIATIRRTKQIMSARLIENTSFHLTQTHRNNQIHITGISADITYILIANQPICMRNNRCYPASTIATFSPMSDGVIRIISRRMVAVFAVPGKEKNSVPVIRSITYRGVISCVCVTIDNRMAVFVISNAKNNVPAVMGYDRVSGIHITKVTFNSN